VRGSLAYDPNYLINDPPTGDYAALIAGTKTWPVPSGTLGGSEDATHVDDLWHAAVNGRGQYFSASNSVDLSNAIASTLSDVTRAQGTASAAAASTLTPTATDDWLFLTRYDSKDGWNGNLYAFHFGFTASGDPTQPDTDPLKAEWNVRKPLQDRDWTTRKIFFNNGTGTAPVKTDFDYTLMGATQKLLFDGRCTVAATKLTQCAGTKMSTNAKTKADLGANLVNFLRGDTSLLLSDVTLDNQVWRSRIYRMGDVVNASPVYVAQPSFRFTDAGYATFVASKANRTKVVYVAANDGMLHAFKVVDKRDSNTSASAAEKATAGDELWAFVPTAVMSELWRLADSDYDNSHRYFVDATPNVGDVWDANASKWRTILVGGLGAGGRGYYALDVTDPLAPTVLWEFSDTNLGLTYGNPVITKNKAGTWVVAFTSGINNVSPGDGLGRLYIVDAITGRTISGQDALVTNVGSTTTPSNLGRLNAWVVKDTDNTALRYYAGDMLGNLWRFDADDLWPPSGREAFLLGQALTSTGDPQPITAKPMLTEISVGGALVPLISFGTGRFLGDRDVTDSTLQTFYTVKDTLLGTGLGTLRDARANLVHLQLDSSRALTSKPVIDWNANNGWYVDLTVTSRERVYLDASPIASSVIAFASVAPTGDPCSAGGESWLYLINLKSGELSPVEHYLTPVVGLGRIEGTSKVYPLVTTQDGLGNQGDGVTKGGDIEPVTRRTSWRELQE
jgi:type IV pilus assembly protein PilY1